MKKVTNQSQQAFLRDAMATLEYTREQFAERIGTRKRTLDNWRLTFRFDGDDAEVVDYQDYH